MKKLVIASNNPGKVRELEALLAPLGIEAVPQAAFGVREAEEPHDTFLENALAKARHASLATGLPALADDSGLCVPALDGAPGVHSAYFAGREGDRATRDARNNAKLLESLRGTADRRAFYACLVVLVHGPRDPLPLVAEGFWHGTLGEAARGSGGFGYDPYFVVEGGRTAAEIPAEDKNRMSHRGQALRALAARLAAGR